MSHLALLEASVVLLLLGALVSLVVARRRRLSGWIGAVFAIASAAVVWVLAVGTFASGPEPAASLAAVPVVGADLLVGVDGLSAFFLVVVMTIAPLSALYSVDYMAHYPDDSVAKFFPVLLVFFASLVAVLVTLDFLFFLVFWELMTLSSYFLVTFEREGEQSQRAGLKYFVITHAATLCMVAAALVLWNRAGSFHFDAMGAALTSLLADRPSLGHLVILLFFLGFATKAGILPMGDWLPDAHPVAPSGMSAVLSGALVKVGIYGLVRVFVSFVADLSVLASWGVVLALVGTVSLFVGTLSALRQLDTKRLLAFHTIGQLGYVCLGLGVGVACLRDHPGLAALSLMGALLHVANHACFKSCLFLGAGSVLMRTGERDMQKLGGLGAFMPLTSASTTVASLSIGGVPPLNGFASKWLIIASCLLAGLHSPLFLLLGLVALFISLVTLASFMKVLGAVFLGSPSTDTSLREVPLTMLIPQLVLAALCVLLGLFPQVPLHVLGDAIAAVAPGGLPPADSLLGGFWGLTLTVDGVVLGAWAPLAIGGALVLLGLVGFGIQRSAGAGVRDVPVWLCGEEHDPDAVRYRAGSFSAPFKHVFAGIYPSARTRVPRFPKRLRAVLELDRWLYDPLVRLVQSAARTTSRAQTGTPQVYLVWIVAGAVLVVGTMLAVLG